jgi:D-beta-D-heptose 7-phosphate kinase/D-beta-D-heptose 1-phosphate adenosyltransferase
MKQSQQISFKILTQDQLNPQLKRWKLLGKNIVFTNGVFDIVHQGHLSLLNQAAAFADILIVGVNSDTSVKKLKGNSRPVNGEYSRALLLASLLMVDAVIIFDEETPINLIKTIKPNVLVKGGDYTVNNIVGAKEILDNGGEVKIVKIEEGFSTSLIIEKAKKATGLNT